MSLTNKEKRITEVALAVENFNDYFSTQGFDLNFKANAVELIVNNYELLLDNVIKRYLKEGTNANIYKVASGMELSTVYTQPIIHNNLDNCRSFNALLAYSIAAHLIFSYKFNEMSGAIDSSPYSTDIESLVETHITWLKYIDTHGIYHLPTFCNALFWQSLAALLRRPTN